MKIFIDAGPMFKNRSGVGQYAKRLTETVAKLSPQNQYTLFSFRLWGKPLPPREIKGTNVNYKFMRFMPGRVYNMLFRLGIRLPLDLMLLARPDIIFSPNFKLWPTISRKPKTVVVIHDMSFVHFPQFANGPNRWDMLHLLPRAIANASHIITISKSSKEQIVDYYKIDQQRVSIVTPAVDHGEYRPQTSANVAAVRKKYKLPVKYILSTSTLEPRKNIEGLLEAYAKLDIKTKRQYALVLAGGKGWQDQSIEAAIGALRASGEQIITTGYVPDADLPAIYSGAGLFVFPSFYEGFGMPPLEAMACGVPVITSNNSSLPEVVGNAAIKIRAEDTAAITEAVQRVLSDKQLAKDMRQKGLAQAAKFSWEKSAEDLMKVFNDLAAK